MMSDSEPAIRDASLPDIIKSVVDGFTTLHSSEESRFQAWARDVKAYQRTQCKVYSRLEGYEYLPVQAFKMTDVASFPTEHAERVFVSSGTRNQERSRHFVADESLYRRSVLAGYDRFIADRFGWKDDDIPILGHLPAYAEESSLVAMVKILMNKRGSGESAFFMDDHSVLEKSLKEETPLLLFGAAFGLLDLIEKRTWPLPTGSVVIETGGMKTHRREVVRSDLHSRLSTGFRVPLTQVVSEYGMCELMSQCYSDERGIFRTPPWMRHMVLNPEDGRTPVRDGEEGVLALFDLANVHTVSAILTEDRATTEDGGFVIHGRLSAAELRGCNFLLESG